MIEEIESAGDAADELVLRRESNVLNLNAQLGPWQALTLAAAVQSDWTRQEGFGNANLGGFVTPLDANLNRQSTSEQMTLRFTGIPYVVLHAEGRLQQENLDQFERQTVTDGFDDARDFLRDTEARSDQWEARTGFTVSPWTFLTLDASYRLNSRDSHYDHTCDFDGSSEAETVTGLESASVAPYEGQINSVMASATFALDAKTDLTAAYAFSKADYDQRGETDGLPLSGWSMIDTGWWRASTAALNTTSAPACNTPSIPTTNPPPVAPWITPPTAFWSA